MNMPIQWDNREMSQVCREIKQDCRSKPFASHKNCVSQIFNTGNAVQWLNFVSTLFCGYCALHKNHVDENLLLHCRFTFSRSAKNHGKGHWVGRILSSVHLVPTFTVCSNVLKNLSKMSVKSENGVYDNNWN